MVARILMLTRDDDVPARHLGRMLTARGAEVVVFDPGGFPTSAKLSATLASDGTIRRRLVTADRAVDLETLTAVWFGRPSQPTPHPEVVDPIMRTYVRHESTAFADDLWSSLRYRGVPARAEVVRSAGHKLSQLVVASQVGFEIPPTLITTDPDELLDFYCTHDGKIVTKVIEQLSFHHQDEGFFRLTELVSTRDLGYANALRLCPVIVQPYVSKAFEVRVTVVGSRVFAVEIHSQASNRARLDWRSYDLHSTPHRVHRLPDAVAVRCLRLVEQLGLCYGAIDLIVTPDGQHVFLEINPTGQYLWLEEATGLPISEALCDLLLGHDLAPARASSREHAA